MIAFLILETLMIGVFCALDLVLFYVFFEAKPDPDVHHHRRLGGKRRVYASFKFFLYTLLGSVLMMLAIMAMFFEGRQRPTSGRSDANSFPTGMQQVAVARLLRLLRVKDADVAGPHLAADAHVEGADRGLASPGSHPPENGRLRLHCVSRCRMFPDASLYFQPMIFALSVIAIVYTSLVAPLTMQEEHQEADRLFLRRPYGLRDDGHLRDEPRGYPGRHLQMLSHGLISGALFLCVASSTTGCTPARSPLSAAGQQHAGLCRRVP